jgi:Subtilase family
MNAIRLFLLLAVISLVCLLTPLSAQVAADANSLRVCPQPTDHKWECTSRLLVRVPESMPKASGVVKRSGVNPDFVPFGYGPADLLSAYNLAAASASKGTGVTIAIVDAYEDPDAESDLATYRSTFGLPACTTANGCFKKVNQSGQTSPLPAGDSTGAWELEESNDLDMASAICPNCHILLVESNTNSAEDLITAVTTAASLGANVISNSYGGSEYDGEQVYTCPSYSYPGIAVVASSGDSGYGTQQPAACPNVTSVGGTSLVTASNSRGWSETVWNSNDGGPGSGCSAYEPKPSYQTDSGCSNRTIADVSAVADPNTGVAAYDTFPYYGYSYGWVVLGGTSVAAPVIGGVYALATPPNATDYPSSYPYASPGDLNDVTSGTNVVSGGPDCGGTYLCVAGVGYDGPTGLGTPFGTTAFGPFEVVAAQVTASPSSIPFGNVEECPIKKTAKQTVTLIDNGTTKVQIGPISFVSITGNPSDFTFHLYCAGTLGPKKGHSCTIGVAFSPSALISEGATLNIVTNAPGSPLQIPITGAGIAGPKCKSQ